MSQEKKSNVNTSSLIDLKAELLRKQQQFQKEKSGKAGYIKAKLKEKKSDLWSQSNAGVRERAQRDMEQKQEDEDALSKSRKRLEAKARLYEAMTSSKTIPEEDGSKRFLVDFERKTIDKLVDEKRAQESMTSEVDPVQSEREKQDKEDVQKLFLNEKVPSAQDPEEEWVDYTDSLGRSRRCMKKDLPELMEMDKKLSNTKSVDHPKAATTSLIGDTSSGPLPDLMSSDMYRERLRAQWEKDEREAMDGPLHYSNVQFDEIRTHGVGFYQFDKKNAAREEQMQELQKLREQTKDKRAAHKEFKNKRKAMLASRLAKVRQRKLIREGKDPAELSDLDKSEESDDDIIGPRPEEKEPEPEPLTRDDSWRKTAPVRDWDKGKEGLDKFLEGQKMHTEESWKEKLREERIEDFAPPSFYQDNTGARNKIFSNKPSPFYGKKSAPTDSMANLEENKSNDTTNTIAQTLSAIRSEVNNRMCGVPTGNTKGSEETSSKTANLANIPLPPMSMQEQPPGTSQAVFHMPQLHQTSAQPPQGVYQHSSYGNLPFGPNPYANYQPQMPYGILPPMYNAVPSYTGGTIHPPGTENISPSVPNPTTIHAPGTEKVPLSVRNPSTIHPPGTENISISVPNPTTIHAPGTEIVSPSVPNSTTIHAPGTKIVSLSAPNSTTIHAPGTEIVSPSVPNSTTIHAPGTENISPSVPNPTTIHPITSVSTTELTESMPEANTDGEMSAELEAGPQPAHYSSGPMKPQPKKPRYERVNIHELPLTLPVPPTASNTPVYPSQEDVLGFQQQKQEAGSEKTMSEEQAMKQWKRQFQYKIERPSDIKPSNIPFASPYIQNMNKPSKDDPAVEFDPSKPPPSSK